MKYPHQKVIKLGKIFVISAPSGGGKTTITNGVLHKLEKKYQLSKVITYTSRAPRINEIDGKDYFFLSRQAFLKKIKEGFFLETTEYNGEFYGSPASIISDLHRGRSLILIADRDGAKSIKKLFDASVLIWIVPPNIQILEERLQARKTESDADVRARIRLAEQEIVQEKDEKIFKYHVINSVFEEAVDEICLIIIQELA